MAVTGTDAVYFSESIIRKQYQALETGFQGVLDSMRNYYASFMSEANQVWASDEAVTFQKTTDEKEDSLERSLKRLGDQVLEDLSDSIYSFTSGHGDPVRINHTDFTGTRQAVDFENKQGEIVGINVEEMLNSVLPAYEKNMTALKTSLESLPTDVCMVDSTGEVQGAVKTGVDKVKGKIDTLVEEIGTEIKNLINTQLQVVDLHVQDAAGKFTYYNGN